MLGVRNGPAEGGDGSPKFLDSGSQQNKAIFKIKLLLFWHVLALAPPVADFGYFGGSLQHHQGRAYRAGCLARHPPAGALLELARRTKWARRGGGGSPKFLDSDSQQNNVIFKIQLLLFRHVLALAPPWSHFGVFWGVPQAPKLWSRSHSWRMPAPTSTSHIQDQPHPAPAKSTEHQPLPAPATSSTSYFHRAPAPSTTDQISAAISIAEKQNAAISIAGIHVACSDPHR